MSHYFPNNQIGISNKNKMDKKPANDRGGEEEDTTGHVVELGVLGSNPTAKILLSFFHAETA